MAGNKKILHFEDEEYISEMYGLLFEQSGFTYSHYGHPPSTAPELVELVLKENPDIILMDVMMPFMDGFEAAKILRSDPATAAMPVVGMSNIWQADEIAKALEAGMIEYLGKVHYKPSEIVGIVSEYLADPVHYEAKCRRYL